MNLKTKKLNNSLRVCMVFLDLLNCGACVMGVLLYGYKYVTGFR